jgi:hypothetical protein
MTVPSTQVHFDVWPFRPDLVQKGVDHYNKEMVENVKLDVISASYTSVVETKLLSGDLDVAYDTPDAAHKVYSAGLTHDLNDIKADTDKGGRILWNVSDIKAEINKDYPSFIGTYTTLDDAHYYGLPYYQSVLGALLANNKVLTAAGLQPATGYDETTLPQSYDDLFSQIATVKSKGAADNPWLPLWYTAFPGWGLPQGLMAEMTNRYGFTSLFAHAPSFAVAFDTNTSLADVLKNWKAQWDANNVPHGIITLSSDSDVDGLFETGTIAFASWWLYNMKVYQNPTQSKTAGFTHPVKPNKNGWGYVVQQGFIMREIADPALKERAEALITWLSYKDKEGAYFEPLNIAAFADIAAHTAFKAANVSSAVQDSWKAALVDPANETSIMNDVLTQAAFNETTRASWGDDWMIAITDNVPKYLTGQQDLNTTISKMKTKATALVASGP